MTSIPELQQRKEQVHQVFSKADAALHQGKISQAERDALLRSYYATADEGEAVAGIELEMASMRAADPVVSRATVLVIGFTLLMLTLFATLFYSTGGITGAAVLEQNTTYFTNSTIQLAFEGVTRLNVTGGAAGDGSILILADDGARQYTLYEFRHGAVATAHARLPKPTYVEGEQVTFEATAVSAAYLMTATEAIPLDTSIVENLSAGEYAIKLIINDTGDGTGGDAGSAGSETNQTGDAPAGILSQEVLRFSVVPPGTPAPSEAFDTCGDLCDTNITGNLTLRITIEGNATLRLDRITTTTEANRAPQLIHAIPDVTAQEVVRIDVSGAFSDPEGDRLYFDSSHHEGMAESIGAGIFTVAGEPGTYTYTIYASDLHELTPSNIFSVTITAPNSTGAPAGGADAEENATEANATAPSNTTTITIPTTPADMNATANETGETATPAANMTADTTQRNTTEPADGQNAGPLVTTCDDPDPNLRPLSCIQGNDSRYFLPEQIVLESKRGVAVGQLTPVGNLLIRGGLVEQTTGRPDAWDYQLGYTDASGEFVPTLWVETQTGDLHIAGSLTEANGNIPQRGGYSALVNKRGIILALIDPQTGDLILRGNLVPYRRSLG